MQGAELLGGRYELRGVLGRGGMAEVRDGWDTRLNRAVAIKLLYPQFSAQPEMRRRFQDEARAAAGLNHPNIVAVHDCGEHDGTPSIVMERLPGGTVADLIAHGPLPQEQVHSILDHVLAGLAIAHAAGILHRDIKPGNILLAASGDLVKVADFGIAKTPGAAHTMTGQLVGTMAYLSPERLGGAPASVADDLYAVGVVGYETLAGHRPFMHDDNVAALARAILHDPPPPLQTLRPDLDPRLGAVVQQAMARDTRLRFSSAEDMRAALNGDQPLIPSGAARAAAPTRPPTKVLETPPIPPVSGTFVPPGTFAVPISSRSRPGSRRKRLLAAAPVFAVLTVAALAFAALPNSSETGPPEPVTTSTPAPTPVSTPPPPPPPAVPIQQSGEDDGNNGNGKGPGWKKGPGGKKRG